MRRRRCKQALLWDLDPKEPSSVADARVALALIRCVRGLKGTFSSGNFDDLGEVLAPLVARQPKQLFAALHDYERRRISAGRDAFVPEGDNGASLAPTAANVFTVLLDSEVSTVLGQAFAMGNPAFRVLFDKATKTLEAFVEQHRFAADKNLEIVIDLLALAPPEAVLVRLATACSYSSIRRTLFGFVKGPSRTLQSLEFLCHVRGPAAVRMFDSQSPLKRCALLENVTNGRNGSDLDDLLELSTLGEVLLGTPFENEHAMAQAVLAPLAGPKAKIALQWPHLKDQHALIKTALTAAVDDAVPGVNILLYGGPGTGKTEFVRQLLAEIGVQAYTVRDADDDGDEASRGERLTYLRLSQTFAGKNTRAVLVLDEAEDIFRSDYRHPTERTSGRNSESKSWMNDLLETNAHPVIWISNRISQLDPAYLRRFSCCLEFPQTPQSLRRTIAKERLGAIGCSDSLVDAMASNPQVTPAHLDTAARFASLMQRSALNADAAVNFVIGSHMRASGHEAPLQVASRTTRFDLRYLNVQGNATPVRIVESLERMAGGSGNSAGTALLFSGPPGTGKTQLAAEIATRLGRNLVVRTASDINSKWHGESEQNVAKMFREFDSASEVLFLDEAETLLGSREESAHRANRAVTGEFLRWLETFQGTFICATNHASTFDSALMRRFTFRLEFQPLTQLQRLELFAEMTQGWKPGVDGGPIEIEPAVRTQLDRLDRLTPGDFANAARRICALELPASAWLQELQIEQNAKQGARSARIAFV
jgi:SpoVK/Ycf46/Vps4 family AAA+-type ATPase